MAASVAAAGPLPLVVMPHVLPELGTLEWREEYERCGGNGLWQVRPAILHFGGFEPGRTHRQVVRVVNCSSLPQRLHVLQPRTPHVTFDFDKRFGAIAPGMALAVTVTFKPEELRYHYDVMRIHCRGSGNLQVPIHCYPVMNSLVFPARIDLGHCPLHHTTTRTVRMACKVPLPFEFELTVLRPHPHFKVSPLSGVVPPHGHVDVTISFTPQALRTAFLELRVWLSQYNFQPFTVTVTASSLPGQIRRAALVQAAAELGLLGQRSAPSSPPTRAQTDHSQLEAGGEGGEAGHREEASVVAAETTVESAYSDDSHRRLLLSQHKGADVSEGLASCLDHYDASAPRTPRLGGSGAAFDAGGQWLTAKRIQAFQRRPQKPPEEPPSEQIVDGLRIPADLSTMQAVNFILTQQPGKLKPRDLQAAIREVRRVRAEQKAQQEALRTMTGGGSAGGLGLQAILAEAAATGQTRQLRELVFLQDVREIDKLEKEREFKASAEWVGERPLRPHEVSKIKWTRESLGLLQQADKREADRQRVVVEGTGPMEPVSRAARPETVVGFRPEHGPDFDVYKADDWRQRAATTRRLVHLVSKVMVRRRAGRRLSAIRAWLGLPHVKRTRDEVRRMVDADWEAAKDDTRKKGAAGGGGGATAVGGGLSLPELAVLDPQDFSELKEPLPSFEIHIDKIRDVRFPVWEERQAGGPAEEDEDEDEEGDEGGAGAKATGAKEGGVPVFMDLQPLTLREPKEAAAMGYSELKLPAHCYYPPLELQRPLRDGSEPPPPGFIPGEAAAAVKGGKK